MTQRFSNHSQNGGNADQMGKTRNPNPFAPQTAEKPSHPPADADAPDADVQNAAADGPVNPTSSADPDVNAPEWVNDPDDELLTAFLDDELDSGEKKRAEERLAAEPVLRERLEKLRAAGRLLDSLETVPLNRQLTETTMEILTAVVKREIQAAEKRRRIYNLGLAAVVVLIVGGLFILSHRGMRRYFDDSDRVEADYPVFSRLDALEAVRNFDFLKRLREVPFFTESSKEILKNDPETEAEASSLPDSPSAKSSDPPSAPLPSETAADWTPPERNDSTEMFLRKARFYSLSNSDREHYRAFYRQIEESPDKGSLFALLDRFEKWFWREIGETDRYRFWREPEEKRIDFVIQLIEKRKNEPIPSPRHLSPFGTPPFRSDPLDRDKGFNRFDASVTRHGGGGGQGDRERYPRRYGGPGRWAPFDLKSALPEELREEKLDVRDDFCAFFHEKQQGETPFDGKRKREILSDFIQEKGIGFFTEQLSERGRKFLAPLADDQKIRQIGLLIQIGLYEKRGEPRFMDKKDQNEADSKRGRLSGHDSPSLRTRTPPNGPFLPPSRFDNDPIGFFWKTESTRDLAETLRQLPEKTRDELLSLPDEEMYSQLLILHWGFDPKLGPFSPAGPRGGKPAPRGGKEPIFVPKPADSSQEGTADSSQEGAVNPPQEGSVDSSQEEPGNPSQEGAVDSSQESPADSSQEAPDNPSQEGAVDSSQESPADPSQEGAVNPPQEGSVDSSQEGPADPSKSDAA